MLHLRFWRPSLNGRLAAKHSIASVEVLALLVGLLTRSGQMSHARSAAVQAPQPSLAGQSHSTTVQTLVHNSSVPRFDAFVRGPDGALWHRWWHNGVWYNWEFLGGSLASAPAAIAFGGGIQVFYLGDYGEIWQVSLQVSATTTTVVSWNDWGGAPTDLFDSSCDDFFHFCSPTYFTSAPAVTSMNDGRMDVFALAEDQHHLLHRWWTNDITGCSFIFCDDSNGWSDWEILSVANYDGDPVAVSWPGRMDVFIRSDDTHVYDKTFDGAHWSLWQDLGGTMLYSPAAASWGPGRIDLFVVGLDQQLYHKWYDYGQWYNDWQNLGGTLTSSPSASSWGIGRIDVAVRGPDSGLWHKWYDANWTGWSDWQSLVGTLTSAPAVVDSWQPS